MRKILIFGSIFTCSAVFAAPMGTSQTQPTTVQVPPLPASSAKMQSTPYEIPKDEVKKPLEMKDRFTSTEDHKLGSQIRVQIAEIIGAPKTDGLILIIDSGDVKLIGKVPSEELKAKIVHAVQQIKGVKSVNNSRLEVQK